MTNSVLVESGVDRAVPLAGYLFAALSASFISMGLVRFAYTALLPSLIQAHWFGAADVIYLAAANLGGYLIGALLGRPVAGRVGSVHALRFMSVLASLSALACAVPLSVSWFFAWRLLSGICGGGTVVLVAMTVLPHVPQRHRGLASGAIFLGLGLGLTASGTLVPLLLRFGLQAAWLGVAAVSALLTLLAWRAWPTAQAQKALSSTSSVFHPVATPAAPRASIFPYVAMALMALAPVSPMLFLVDFAVRDLHLDVGLGALSWILYGVGAMSGPLLYGYLSDRFGAARALKAIYLVQAALFVGLVCTQDFAELAVLSVLTGTFVAGIIPLTQAWIRETIPDNADRQNGVWAQLAIVYSGAQALGGYGYSALLNETGSTHRVLFALSAAGLGLALLIIVYVRNATPAYAH